VNTKACISETANSSPIRAKNIIKGIKVNTATNMLPENNLYK